MEWRRFVTYLWNDPRTYMLVIGIGNFPGKCGLANFLIDS